MILTLRLCRKNPIRILGQNKMRTIFHKLKFGIFKPQIFITAEVNTVMTSNKEIGRKLLKNTFSNPWIILYSITYDI